MLVHCISLLEQEQSIKDMLQLEYSPFLLFFVLFLFTPDMQCIFTAISGGHSLFLDFWFGDEFARFYSQEF